MFNFVSSNMSLLRAIQRALGTLRMQFRHNTISDSMFLGKAVLIMCLPLPVLHTRTGRPGPVLVDLPKDIQQQLAVPDWDAPMAITGYMSRLPAHPEASQLVAVAKAIKGAKKPVSEVRAFGGRGRGGGQVGWLG